MFFFFFLFLPTMLTRISQDLTNHSKISSKVWMLIPSHLIYKMKGSHWSIVKHLKVFLYKYLNIIARINMKHNTENYVDGEALFQLTEKDICEMVPPIGLTKKILYLIQLVCEHCCFNFHPFTGE